MKQIILLLLPFILASCNHTSKNTDQDIDICKKILEDSKNKEKLFLSFWKGMDKVDFICIKNTLLEKQILKKDTNNRLLYEYEYAVKDDLYVNLVIDTLIKNGVVDKIYLSYSDLYNPWNKLYPSKSGNFEKFFINHFNKKYGKPILKKDCNSIKMFDEDNIPFVETQCQDILTWNDSNKKIRLITNFSSKTNKKVVKSSSLPKDYFYVSLKISIE
jgi:hypothetical protein